MALHQSCYLNVKYALSIKYLPQYNGETKQHLHERFKIYFPYINIGD